MSELISAIQNNMDEVERLRYDVTWKNDGSPVTSADVFLETLIKSKIQSLIPSVEFVGEETFVDGEVFDQAGFHALLDPIDGTENFCSGLKEWGTAFTLWHGTTHLGSFLFMPELGEHLMTGDRPKKLQSRIRGFSSSMCPEILDGMADTRESRITGCAVYNLYNVIRGSFGRFTNPRGAYAWDLLPGLMLALENNCTVFLEGQQYHGELLEPGRKYRVDIWHRYDLHLGQGTLRRSS